MLLPLPPPPPPSPTICSRRHLASSHQLSLFPAASPTVLFHVRHLRSHTPSFRKHLTSSSSSTPAFAFSFASSPTVNFHKNLNWAAEVEHDAHEEEDEERIIGDCLVFEEGAFEGGDPFLPPDRDAHGDEKKRKKPQRRRPDAGVSAEDLVPEKWKEVLAEFNLTKKEKRRIAQQLKFGSRVERRKKLPVPDLVEYQSYRDMKLLQLKPVVLDNPRELPPPPRPEEVDTSVSGRVSPRNPRLAVGDGSLEVITDFFKSGEYVPGEGDDDKKPGDLVPLDA